VKLYSIISDIQYYLPSRLLSNEELVSDNPDWRMDDIEKKTGIKNRYICEDSQTSKDIALLACEKLFKNNIKRSEIDFLIVVTESPEYIAPAMSCDLQNILNLKTSVAAFDINLGCSGFVYGLMIADSILRANSYNNGILVCVDTYSKYISPNDRTCRPLFSDAASATLITSSRNKSVGPFELGTDGTGYQDLIVQNSGTKKHTNIERNLLHMDGGAVFMFTMRTVPNVVNNLLKKEKYKIDDIDLFVFHQASKLVIDNIKRLLKLPEEKVYENYQLVGNTVSSSIPIALAQAKDDNRLKKGSITMIVGFGVGLSWGATLIRYI
jgi:3-oxoacyl-[acyl-carrier-protein] synthase III